MTDVTWVAIGTGFEIIHDPRESSRAVEEPGGDIIVVRAHLVEEGVRQGALNMREKELFCAIGVDHEEFCLYYEAYIVPHLTPSSTRYVMSLSQFLCRLRAFPRTTDYLELGTYSRPSDIDHL
ncbi:hypothetical protein Salat_0935000 [Sesamum alatum]|uniref:Uncharacterized protein n=1 Tax=Sesamum alatum TaxID=300844 RepID=A0AAE1YJZ4_9LAMI|nr:hypothetical protein Salat_0935000 [Sesamum alatum]